VSSDDHIETVRRYIAAGNERDYATLDSLRADDFVAHVPRSGSIEQSEPVDAATLNKDLQMITTAFPDLNNRIRHVISADDVVAIRAELTGTFTGPLGAAAPTRQPIAWDSAHFYRVSDGMIAEAWFVTDTLGLLRQAEALALVAEQA
jgi:predicted ester cyclase